MARLNASGAYFLKRVAEELGKLIHSAPNESVRAKLRYYNSQGNTLAKDALAGKDLPDNIVSNRYKKLNKIINDAAIKEAAEIYSKVLSDFDISSNVEENQSSADLDSKPEEVVESETEPEEETIQLVDCFGKVHNVLAHNKRKNIAVIQNVLTGFCYDQEFDGDFEKLQKLLGKDYTIINCK